MDRRPRWRNSTSWGWAIPPRSPRRTAAACGAWSRPRSRPVRRRLPRETSRVEALDAPRVAIVGRPNVGKSTLVNTLLGEERVIAFDEPGTTRDAIEVDFERGRRNYTLIDTAGVRTRGKVVRGGRKVFDRQDAAGDRSGQRRRAGADAQGDISEQDAHIAGFILEAGPRAGGRGQQMGRPADTTARDRVKRELARKLGFLALRRTNTISARDGKGVRRCSRRSTTPTRRRWPSCRRPS